MDGDPYYYTRKVKEAIHTRLHPDNINRDGGIEIPEALFSLPQATSILSITLS